MCNNEDIISVFINYSLPYFVIYSLFNSLFWNNKHSLMVHLVLLIQTMLVYIAKELIQIERPSMGCGIGHAFPSWHAVTIVCLMLYYGYLFYQHKVWDKWGVLVMTIRLLVLNTYSIAVIVYRVPLYNTISSVAGSIVVGFLFGIAFIAFTRKFQLQQMMKYE